MQVLWGWNGLDIPSYFVMLLSLADVLVNVLMLLMDRAEHTDMRYKTRIHHAEATKHI